ncbi:efflux RND transporter periplasmic adaptor subunit [Rehaibacterium terrae]|uniref:RND family efflux transporter MFP subunit n=1 Tax=Rehaibacterium terrae TaxID=1341696 RepID=A0A7W8DCX1_9GAMM|nr:efflux RND transporter periplasmic adaptor subunit [Rehaibacterium terrae]MBB5014791.1 RND family efflux transporter MFP subunit [Rehaibacterium terrae]
MDRAEELLKELRIERRQGAPRKRRRWPWIAGAVIALLLVWMVLDATRPVEVETTAARPADDPASASVLDASGYVTARRQATVSAKITGKVAEVLIEEGMRVDEGQVLARLDDVDAQAQRALSAAQLAAARAQLTEVQANLDLAERTLQRQRALFAQRLTSQAALDQAQAERDALAARRVSVQRQIASAENALRIAEIGVENTIVRAPFAGVVIEKAAQPGEMISPISAGGGFTRTGIGTIVDMDSLEVQVDVNEAYIGRVRAGQPVEAVLNAYPDWRIPAEVIAIIPAADRSKATVRVRIALKISDPRIVPDMGVRVSFLAEPRADDAPAPQGAWVPGRAIVTRDGRSVAFVVIDGRAVERAVTVAETRDNDRFVTAGLAAGEQVVLSPPARLGDGDRVRPKSP